MPGYLRTWACLRDRRRAHRRGRWPSSRRLDTRSKHGSAAAPTGRRGHACVWRSECVEIAPRGSTQRPKNPRERGIFTKHRAIHRFSARRYSRVWRKRWYKFPILNPYRALGEHPQEAIATPAASLRLDFVVLGASSQLASGAVTKPAGCSGVAGVTSARLPVPWSEHRT